MLKAEDPSTWTELERQNALLICKFKQIEYTIYKDFHRSVLKDDGNPTLRKTAFRMPGYRKVFKGQLKEYEIENDNGLLLDDIVSNEDESSQNISEESESGIRTNEVQQVIRLQKMFKQGKSNLSVTQKVSINSP